MHRALSFPNAVFNLTAGDGNKLADYEKTIAILVDKLGTDTDGSLTDRQKEQLEADLDFSKEFIRADRNIDALMTLWGCYNALVPA